MSVFSNAVLGNDVDCPRVHTDEYAEPKDCILALSKYFQRRGCGSSSDLEWARKRNLKPMIKKTSRRTNRSRRKQKSSYGEPRAELSLVRVRRRGSKRAKRSVLRRPNFNALSEKANKFTSEGEEILLLYKQKELEKCKSEDLSPYSKCLGVFKRKAYHHIRRLISNPGGLKILESIHHHLEIRHKGPSISENPFYWGLLAMDHEREAPVLSPQVAGLLARQMFYAHRHGVPPCLFIGFLYQADIASGITKKRSMIEWEDWPSDQQVIMYQRDQLADQPQKD